MSSISSLSVPTTVPLAARPHPDPADGGRGPALSARRPGPPSRSPRRTAGVAAALATALALALTVLGAGPASAHDAFTGSNPTNGATVATTPDSVTLDFEEPPTSIGLTVKVTGPSGDIEDGAPAIEGSTVVQKLLPGAPAGSYRIAWRVTSDDGHPVSGELSFTSSAANARQASATPMASTPTSTSAAGGGTSSAASSTSPTSVAAAPASSTGGGSALPVVLVVIVVVLVAAGAVLLLRRRRSV